MTTINAQIISDFRARKPEFADTNAWPDDTLEQYLQDADAETGSTGRWGSYANPSFKQRGMFAFAAHLAVINRAVQNAVAAGGVPTALQQAQSKTVGDESVSYASAAPGSSESDSAGSLRSTFYGQEFLRLRRRASMGAATTSYTHL